MKKIIKTLFSIALISTFALVPLCNVSKNDEALVIKEKKLKETTTKYQYAIDGSLLERKFSLFKTFKVNEWYSLSLIKYEWDGREAEGKNIELAYDYENLFFEYLGKTYSYEQIKSVINVRLNTDNNTKKLEISFLKTMVEEKIRIWKSGWDQSVDVSISVLKDQPDEMEQLVFNLVWDTRGEVIPTLPKFHTINKKFRLGVGLFGENGYYQGYLFYGLDLKINDKIYRFNENDEKNYWYYNHMNNLVCFVIEAEEAKFINIEATFRYKNKTFSNKHTIYFYSIQEHDIDQLSISTSEDISGNIDVPYQMNLLAHAKIESEQSLINYSNLCFTVNDQLVMPEGVSYELKEQKVIFNFKNPGLYEITAYYFNKTKKPEFREPFHEFASNTFRVIVNEESYNEKIDITTVEKTFLYGSVGAFSLGSLIMIYLIFARRKKEPEIW